MLRVLCYTKFSGIRPPLSSGIKNKRVKRYVLASFRDDSQTYHMILQFHHVGQNLGTRPYLGAKKPGKRSCFFSFPRNQRLSCSERRLGLRGNECSPTLALSTEFLSPILPNSFLFCATNNTSKSGKLETLQARNLSA